MKDERWMAADTIAKEEVPEGKCLLEEEQEERGIIIIIIFNSSVTKYVDTQDGRTDGRTARETMRGG